MKWRGTIPMFSFSVLDHPTGKKVCSLMNWMHQALQATSQGRIQCDPLTVLSSRTNCTTHVNQKLRAYVSAVIWDARVRRRSWPYAPTYGRIV